MIKSSLSELFSVEDQQKIETSQNRVLIFDGHNLAYRTLFSAVFMNPQDNEKFFFLEALIFK